MKIRTALVAATAVAAAFGVAACTPDPGPAQPTNKAPVADIAALALQGPTSYAVLRAMGLQGLDALKPQAMSDWPAKSNDGLFDGFAPKQERLKISAEEARESVLGKLEGFLAGHSAALAHFTVHTDGVCEVSVTVRPELAVALEATPMVVPE